MAMRYHRCGRIVHMIHGSDDDVWLVCTVFVLDAVVGLEHRLWMALQLSSRIMMAALLHSRPVQYLFSMVHGRMLVWIYIRRNRAAHLQCRADGKRRTLSR